MPKRSPNPGNDAKKNEQLNRAIDAMFARSNSKPAKVEASVESLLRLAADLRDLPSESFKAKLKSKLLNPKQPGSKAEGRNIMSAVAEPITSVQSSAVPRLAFKDAAKAIEFYEQALGAKEVSRFQTGKSIPYAEMALGESRFILTEEWAEGGRFSAETLGHSPVQMVIRVQDVDSFSEHAIAAGMKVVRPLANQFYGHRDIMLADPFGYTWTAFTVTEELSVEEMHRRMKGLTTGPEGGQMPQEDSPKNATKLRPGFRMVTPYLVAADGPGLLDFVQAAFGAQETERAMTPTGVHGEVRVGDSMLMIGGGLPGKKFPSSLHSLALHVYVEDADAACQKAVAAGATLIDAPRDQPYGERSGSVQDKAGNYWYIATAQGESYVPKGLHNVNPYLHPLRAEPLIGFLKRAFGAEEVAKYASPDGVVHHAVVRMGDSVVEMGEAHGKYEPMPAMFYLYVSDCDAQYKQALAAGAKSLHEPKDQPYGDRSAAVTDAFGNIWYVATQIKGVTT